MPRRSKALQVYHDIVDNPSSTPAQKMTAARKIEKAAAARAEARKTEAAESVSDLGKCPECELDMDTSPSKGGCACHPFDVSHLQPCESCGDRVISSHSVRKLCFACWSAANLFCSSCAIPTKKHPTGQCPSCRDQHAPLRYRQDDLGNLFYVKAQGAA